MNYEYVRKLLQLRGMRILDLADQTGIVYTTLVRFLTGEVTPRFNNVCLIADVLNVPVDDLVNVQQLLTA